MESFSESYKAAGVDITAGYKAVQLMKSMLPVPIPRASSRESAASADCSNPILREWRSRF